MSDMGAALAAVLRDDVEVAALVGDRVTPNVLDDNPALPALVYTRVSGVRVSDMDGNTGLVNPRYQVDAYSTNKDEASAVADVARVALKNFQGEKEDVTITSILPLDSTDFYEADTGRHRVSTDFSVWHNEE